MTDKAGVVFESIGMVVEGPCQNKEGKGKGKE
jgi:hypothetical protein